MFLGKRDFAQVQSELLAVQKEKFELARKRNRSDKETARLVELHDVEDKLQDERYELLDQEPVAPV